MQISSMKKLIPVFLLLLSYAVVAPADINLLSDREKLTKEATNKIIDCSEEFSKKRTNHSSLLSKISLALTNVYPNECVIIGTDWLRKSLYILVSQETSASDELFRNELDLALEDLQRLKSEVSSTEVFSGATVEQYGVISDDGQTMGTKSGMPKLPSYTNVSGK